MGINPHKLSSKLLLKIEDRTQKLIRVVWKGKYSFLVLKKKFRFWILNILNFLMQIQILIGSQRGYRSSDGKPKRKIGHETSLFFFNQPEHIVQYVNFWTALRVLQGFSITYKIQNKRKKTKKKNKKRKKLTWTPKDFLISGFYFLCLAFLFPRK